MWRKARKKPVVIEFREVQPLVEIPILVDDIPVIALGERVETLEGIMSAISDRDYIIRGVDGEVYPIKKEIFHKIYAILFEVNTDGEETT